MSLKPEIFLDAAELQFRQDCELRHESFSCHNLAAAAASRDDTQTYLEHKVKYSEYFGIYAGAEGASVWWKRIDGVWQTEPRIYALLLMAEIVKDENQTQEEIILHAT